jgi:hypothetical protein
VTATEARGLCLGPRRPATPRLMGPESVSNDQGFTTAFAVSQTPEDAFAAILNVRGWWSEEIEGSTDRLGDEFTYCFEDIHRSRQRITQLVSGRRVVWQVLDGYLKFAQDTGEWTGTHLIFDISRTDGQTEVRFTHLGLVPEFDCFELSANTWRFYINASLRGLIVTGKGQPN